MKKSLLIASLLTGVVLLNVSQAQATNKYLEEQYVKVCEALRSNSRVELQKAISNVPAGYKQIAEGLICNGMDPITFALSNGAEKTAKFLALRSHKDYDELLAKL